MLFGCRNGVIWFRAVEDNFIYPLKKVGAIHGYSMLPPATENTPETKVILNDVNGIENLSEIRFITEIN